jgi:hypothetical protein
MTETVVMTRHRPDPGDAVAMHANRAIWPNDASQLRAGRGFADETGLVENAWHRPGSIHERNPHLDPAFGEYTIARGSPTLSPWLLGGFFTGCYEILPI